MARDQHSSPQSRESRSTIDRPSPVPGTRWPATSCLEPRCNGFTTLDTSLGGIPIPLSLIETTTCLDVISVETTISGASLSPTYLIAFSRMLANIYFSRTGSALRDREGTEDILILLSLIWS